MKTVGHVLRNFSFKKVIPFAIAGTAVLLALFYMFPVVPDRDEDEYRAMEIIKGLRAVRAAAQMFFEKNPDGPAGPLNIDSLKPYTNADISLFIIERNAQGDWYSGFGHGMSEDVRKKLKARTNEYELLKNASEQYDGGPVVLMAVRGYSDSPR